MPEHDFIARIRAQAGHSAAVLGIGDDCCITKPQGEQCLSIDTVVAGVHFAEDCDPAAVGEKAMASAISDLAAMGAVPRGAVLALQWPRGVDADALMAGALAVCERCACPLLGGDTVSAPVLAVTVTVWGEAVAGGRLLRRAGAQPGDVIAVTGALGGSLLTGRHLHPQPRLAEGQWLAAQRAAHALMDLSDGLAGDLRLLTAESDCGAIVERERIPIHADVPQDLPVEERLRHACCDGEDFELLTAIVAEAWPQLREAWPFAVPLTAIGEFQTERTITLRSADGRQQPWDWQAYEHGGE